MDDSFIFHLAIPINNIDAAKKFYHQGLGCQIGRENPGAIILKFYGHQLVAHMTQEELSGQKGVYPRHFGLVFPHKAAWDEMVTRAQTKQLKFYQQPRLRFPDKITEHWTCFLEDPFFNLLEFKYYSHSAAIFDKVAASSIGDR